MDVMKTKTRQFLITFQGCSKGNASNVYYEMCFECDKLTRRGIEMAREQSIRILSEKHDIEVSGLSVINVVELEVDEDE